MRLQDELIDLFGRLPSHGELRKAEALGWVQRERGQHEMACQLTPFGELLHGNVKQIGDRQSSASPGPIKQMVDKILNGFAGTIDLSQYP